MEGRRVKRKAWLPIACLLALCACGERAAEETPMPTLPPIPTETVSVTQTAVPSLEPPPEFPSPTPSETPPEDSLPFASSTLAQQLCGRLGVDTLTEEELPRLEAMESLRLESGFSKREVSTLEDLPRYCPNLRGLEFSLYNRTLTKADQEQIGKLPLEGLSLYMGEGYESLDLPEGLRSLALSVNLDDGEPLPLESLLLAPADDPEGLLEGKLDQYVCLRAEGWVFELLATDFWNEETEENFWGGWECKVLVSRETDQGLRHVQTLEVQGRPNADADRSLVFADVDFDGRPDLLVWLGHFGAQGLVRYECYLQREGGFEHCESFQEIPNPSIDTENRMILSQIRNSAASHSWGKYEYRDETFVLTAYLTEEPCPESWGQEEDDLIWQWIEETLQSGEMVQNRCWRSDEYTKEEINGIIYNACSDWGLQTDRWRTIYNGGLMADFSIYGE